MPIMKEQLLHVAMTLLLPLNPAITIRVRPRVEDSLKTREIPKVLFLATGNLTKTTRTVRLNPLHDCE